MSTPLDLAVSAYHAQQHLCPEDQLSLCSIATQFGVSTTSVSDQVSGRCLPSKVAHFAEQALTIPEEVAVVECIRRWLLSGRPPTHQSILEIAEHLRHYRHPPSTPPLGQHWIQKFLGRHPDVVSVWTRCIDTCRLDGASPEQLAPWFAEMGALLQLHRYSPYNIFNMDETGFGIGTSQATRVLTVVDRGAKDEGKKLKAWKVS